MVLKRTGQFRWLRLAIVFLVVVIASFGLAYLFRHLVAEFGFPLDEFAWLAYLVVFGTSLLAGLTIIAPVPFATSIMLSAATEWNPVQVALAAAVGGTLGELSGYYAGYLGKKIAISENIPGYSRVERWIQSYGAGAIFVLGIQPIIPFDIGGLIAGAVRMPLSKFLLALFAAKFLKYTIITYFGIDLIDLM